MNLFRRWFNPITNPIEPSVDMHAEPLGDTPTESLRNFLEDDSGNEARMATIVADLTATANAGNFGAKFITSYSEEANSSDGNDALEGNEIGFANITDSKYDICTTGSGGPSHMAFTFVVAEGATIADIVDRLMQLIIDWANKDVHPDIRRSATVNSVFPLPIDYNHLFIAADWLQPFGLARAGLATPQITSLSAEGTTEGMEVPVADLVQTKRQADKTQQKPQQLDVLVVLSIDNLREAIRVAREPIYCPEQMRNVPFLTQRQRDRMEANLAALWREYEEADMMSSGCGGADVGSEVEETRLKILAFGRSLRAQAERSQGKSCSPEIAPDEGKGGGRKVAACN
ncbi:hypothetical protein VTK73DRAFT_9087 [Phialemonium thermophilum]|uniref:Uncharacterized protein n=1 Tax=Phialemonium thermophilum TaxID=223376 RepID=A0ABR3XLJ8_9PEZI